MFWGSEIATQRESPSKAKGMAFTCSRTCSGTVLAAMGSMPTEPSSITGSPCWAATMRAIASLEASPSSISTCTTGWGFAFSRRTSNFASGIRPVVSRRSMTSSPMSCEIGAGAVGPFGAGLPSGVTAGWGDNAGGPLHDAAGGVKDWLARKERDHRAGREEGRKRDPELPGAGAVAREQDRTWHESQAEGEQDSDGCRQAEKRADQEGELDVSHPHSTWIGERRDEQEPGGSDRADCPLGRRMRDRLQCEHRGRRGQHHAVRDDSPFEVGRRHDDERAARDRGCSGLDCEAEREYTADEEQRRGKLDREVTRWNADTAAAAAAAQERIREDRHVVVPAERRFAAHARRAGAHDGAAQGHTGGHHAEEAPERQPGHENERQDEVHLALYRQPGRAA